MSAASTMKTQLRPLVAGALYEVKAHTLPSVCERYGLAPGTGEEAFSSKRAYVMRRLETISDAGVLAVAKRVVEEYPDDALQAGIEMLERSGRLISDVTRRHLAEALNVFALAGKRDLLDLIRHHFPSVDRTESQFEFIGSLADDIVRHVVRNDDWTNEYVLELVGFYACSQARLFGFLEDVVHPIRRGTEEQERIVSRLNPILRRDGYELRAKSRVSGYPVYKMEDAGVSGEQPADAIISQALISFDEVGVHAEWRKALDRRITDPEGAITAAKTLLESVCKHIVEEAGGTYGDGDDLPKLYATAAECLNLAPSQHTEIVFRAILGNCQAVAGHLSAIRNKLGDSHGKGKRHVRPLPRHAELAVNLAGSVATFLVATWNARKRDVPAMTMTSPVRVADPQ